MKLAKASQAEIDKLMRWLQDKEAAKYEDAKNRPPAFLRVVFGYETLVNNVCDPAKDYLDWKPGYAPADVDRLRAERDEADAYILSLWRNNLLPRAMSESLRVRLSSVPSSSRSSATSVPSVAKIDSAPSDLR